MPFLATIVDSTLPPFDDISLWYAGGSHTRQLPTVLREYKLVNVRFLLWENKWVLARLECGIWMQQGDRVYRWDGMELYDMRTRCTYYCTYRSVWKLTISAVISWYRRVSWRRIMIVDVYPLCGSYYLSRQSATKMNELLFPWCISSTLTHSLTITYSDWLSCPYSLLIGHVRSSRCSDRFDNGLSCSYRTVSKTSR